MTEKKYEMKVYWEIPLVGLELSSRAVEYICACCHIIEMHTKSSALAYWCFPRLVKVNSSHILLTMSPTESTTKCPTVS